MLRVDADGQQHPGQFFDLGTKLVRPLVDGYGVQIHDTVDTVVVILDLGPVLQRAKIISNVGAAGGLDAGEDSCFHVGWGELLS
jgi:hypothetical protein